MYNDEAVDDYPLKLPVSNCKEIEPYNGHYVSRIRLLLAFGVPRRKPCGQTTPLHSGPIGQRLARRAERPIEVRITVIRLLVLRYGMLITWLEIKY